MLQLITLFLAAGMRNAFGTGTHTQAFFSFHLFAQSSFDILCLYQLDSKQVSGYDMHEFSSLLLTCILSRQSANCIATGAAVQL